ncbi:MAG: exo-alpha-sialidase [Bacteroidales bacterium]|nr:exo-alpha-sialidase [Bacteroidales bacterium]
MRKLKITSLWILFVLIITNSGPDLFSQAEYSGENLPVLRYTANKDPLNFKYDLLKNTEKTILYRGNPESAKWNHHTMITFHDGILFASWDQQARDENASGQHGLIRRSSDMGKTWTEVEELFPPLSKNVPAADPYPYTRFQTNNGCMVLDGKLFAITDVAEWSAAGKGKIGPRIKLGRMARQLNADGTMGDIFWLLDKAPQPVPGYPSFPTGDPSIVERMDEYLSNPLTEPQLLFGVNDFPGTDDNHSTGEGQAWQLEDGTWVKMFRDSGLKGASSDEEDEASKSRRNYACFSFDNGKTWTPARRTSFPDACGRSTSGRIPGGDYYIVNAGWPLSNKKGGRSIQTLSLSGDGLNYDRTVLLQFIAPEKRYDGRSKAVGFQAHSVVAGDYLFLLSSLNKEDIQLMRIPLSELKSFDKMPYFKKSLASAQPAASAQKERPVVRWTAYGSDDMNFIYNFPENLETNTLHLGTPETGTFNHHSHITFFKGVFYASWDTQAKDEHGPGQHGMMRRSTDRGRTWTPVEELFPPMDRYIPSSEALTANSYRGRIQTSNGFAVVDDILYAITEVDDHRGTSISNRKRFHAGRLCRSINPDGGLGEIFWLTAMAPDHVEGFPAYPAGDPVLVKKINEYFLQPGNEIQLDFSSPVPESDSSTDAWTPFPISDDNHRMIEQVPSYRAKDGTWVRLYRDAGLIDVNIPAEGPKTELEESKSRRNYASYSYDNCTTWSVPSRTSFPDACAKSNAGKLPDGQVYVINNVLPLSTKDGGRSLLGISMSADGLNFDRVAVIRFIAPKMRYSGRAKSIGFQYPHSVVEGDSLWVIYSVNKEDIQVTRIPLSELNRINSLL